MALCNRGKQTEVEFMTIVTFTCDCCLKKVKIADPEPMDYCPFCGRK